MVDRADMVICFVSKSSGRAYRAMEYALKCDKEIIILGETGSEK